MSNLLGMSRTFTKLEQKYQEFSTFSGADIQCMIYVPKSKGIKTFAELQTLSISSSRTVSPVRVLNHSNPRGYVRGARTYAGSMVFTDIRFDALAEVFSVAPSDTSFPGEFFVDQLPGFNVSITAINEHGLALTRSIVGVTLVNYGTTYSIDNMYTESQYTFVAENVTPFLPNAAWRKLRHNMAMDAFAGRVADGMQAVGGAVEAASALMWKTVKSDVRAVSELLGTPRGFF